MRAMVRLVRRTIVGSSVAFAVVGVASTLHAQALDRPVRLVVGSTAGGGVDRAARLLATRLGDELQRTVVVENRDGAGTRLASDFVAKSAPDGNTLLFVTGEATIASPGPPLARPSALPRMIAAAQSLADGIDFVRVDFYEIGGRVVFGELTNYPNKGLNRFQPASLDALLGSWLRLAPTRAVPIAYLPDTYSGD